jgi:hypothetical protein
VVAGLGGRQEGVGHRHGHRGAEQGEAGDALRVPGGGFEHDQGAHGVADQLGRLDGKRVEDPAHPVGHVGHGVERRAG